MDGERIEQLLKAEAILKWILVLAALIFIFMVNVYKLNPCGHCSFEIGEETMDINEFMDFYTGECWLEKSFNLPINLSAPQG